MLTSQPLDLSTQYVLVFSGGGVKAFYGLGWIHSMTERGLKVSEIFATSSGAALSLSLATANVRKVVRDFSERARTHRSFRIGSFVKGGTLSGFEATYSDMITKWLDMDKLSQSDTKLNFVALRLPDSQKRLRTWHVLRMGHCLERDILSGGGRAKEYASRIGARPHLFTKEHFSTKESVLNAVLASSSLPPFVGNHRNLSSWIDGGLIHPAPVREALGKYPDLPIIAVCYHPLVARYIRDSLREEGISSENVHWVLPQEKLHVGSWSFGSPKAIMRCFRSGLRDARKQLLVGHQS